MTPHILLLLGIVSPFAIATVFASRQNYVATYIPVSGAENPERYDSARQD